MKSILYFVVIFLFLVQRTSMTPAQNAAALRGQPITPIKRIDNRTNNQTPALNTTMGGVVQSPGMPAPQFWPPLQPQRASLQITPYPVISQNHKGLVEKIVDYLIGDGPNNRYAMICKECFEHNGESNLILDLNSANRKWAKF